MLVARPSDLDMLAVLQHEHLQSVQRHTAVKRSAVQLSKGSLNSVVMTSFLLTLVLWAVQGWYGCMYDTMPAMHFEMSVCAMSHWTLAQTCTDKFS